jgi:hypothetical protein
MPRPKPQGQTEIDNNFAFHPATEVTGPLHDEVRTQARNLASKWNKALPAGRHKSMAISFLQQAMWAANAAIACDSEGAAPAEDDVEPEETAAEVAEPVKSAAPAKKVVGTAGNPNRGQRAPRKTAAKAAPASGTVTPLRGTGTRRPRAQRASQA